MSDSAKRYKIIRKALKRLYPKEPKGNLARHLNILAALISGIVGSKRVNLPEIAGKVPDDNKPESRIKSFYRWIINEKIDAKIYFLPFVEVLLANLAQSVIFLVMDGSTGGRGCVILMVSIVYKNRALPIAWLVVKGKKGHLPEETHIKLIEQVHQIIPQAAKTVFLGDGEFDGINFLAKLEEYGWFYVCRTRKDSVFFEKDKKVSFADFPLIQGEEPLSLPNVLFTSKAYGPVLAIGWWEEGYEDPIYIISNLQSVQVACSWYKRRFRIETFFSDQKSRGFFLHKSHISDPLRLSRLMIAACLAYIWIIFLGVQAIAQGLHKYIHRTDRCDLSLFQLGLRFLDYLFDKGLPIPVKFYYALE